MENTKSVKLQPQDNGKQPDRGRSADQIYQAESRKVLKSLTNAFTVDLAWTLVGLKP